MAEKKLRPEEVIDIRNSYANGVRVAALAFQYGVSRTALMKLLRGETYKAVTGGIAVQPVSHKQSMIQAVKVSRSAREMRRAVQVLYDADYTQAEMRRALACSERTVIGLMRDLNIYRR